MKKITSIFAAINNDKELIGYFKDKFSAVSALDEAEQDEGRIFEIINVFGVYFPDDPELETYETPLKDVLEEE